MPSETIITGLKKYGIGHKIRRLRLRKSMGLQELAKHTGLSPALISKLERDLMHPTLPTLLRIAMVFSVGLEYFFNPEPQPVLEIVRKQQRIRFPDTPDGKAAYYFESLDFPVPGRVMNSYYAEFEDTADIGECRYHQHPGFEFLYVLTGKLDLLVGEESHQLAQSDAVYFDSSVPHAYRRSGNRRTSALVIALEPRA